MEDPLLVDDDCTPMAMFFTPLPWYVPCITAAVPTVDSIAAFDQQFVRLLKTRPKYHPDASSAVAHFLESQCHVLPRVSPRRLIVAAIGVTNLAY